MTLTYGELEEEWAAGGGSTQEAPLMAGIAEAESGGSPTATNPSGATGLWQIMFPLHQGVVPGATSQAALESPLTNAQAAAALYNPTLSAWDTDTTWADWNAAGQPQAPDAATVQGWLAQSGLAGASDAPATSQQLYAAAAGATAAPTASGTGATATTASITGDIFGSTWNSVEKFLVEAMLVITGLALISMGAYQLVKPAAQKAAGDFQSAASLGALPA